MKMVISINPIHVDKIISGVKRYEYRKTVCDQSVESILIYATAPIKKIVAEAKITEVLVGDIQTIWERTHDFSGISLDFYNQYYHGKKRAVAYHLDDVIEFQEYKSIEEFGLKQAPQSYLYMK